MAPLPSVPPTAPRFTFPEDVGQCEHVFFTDLSLSDTDLWWQGARLCECPDGQVFVLCPGCREWGNCWEVVA